MKYAPLSASSITLKLLFSSVSFQGFQYLFDPNSPYWTESFLLGGLIRCVGFNFSGNFFSNCCVLFEFRLSELRFYILGHFLHPLKLAAWPVWPQMHICNHVALFFFRMKAYCSLKNNLLQNLHIFFDICILWSTWAHSAETYSTVQVLFGSVFVVLILFWCSLCH